MLNKEQIGLLKRVPITSYLATKKYFPVIERSGEYCYFSPFRDEKTPSFYVNTAKNLFVDFDNGQGGDIVSLVMRMEGVGFKGAVSILSSINGETVVQIQEYMPSSPQFQSFISRIGEIKHPALKSYLNTTRGLSDTVVKSYLKEIHYNTSKGKFFGSGFINNSNGWEIRNPSFKGCIGKKDITVIGSGTGVLYVFEGFISFLSWLTHRGMGEIESHTTVCVLNSLSMISKLPEPSNYTLVALYLDNDVSGIREANKITTKHRNSVNLSQCEFPEYSDYNDFICKRLLFS